MPKSTRKEMPFRTFSPVSYTHLDVYKRQGYDLKWIYGGYGYFDNMNYFFGNGFEASFNFIAVDYLVRCV